VHSFLQAQTHLYTINSHEEFKVLSSLPLSSKYGNVYGVKVIYDLNKNKLHYINSTKYEYHFTYCQNTLGFEYDLAVFNLLNYSPNSNQEYLLASINYFEDLDWYVMEIASIDNMKIESIKLLYNSIKASSFFGRKFKFILNTPKLLANKSILEKEISCITPSDIYKDLQFQAISKNSAIGTLKFINKNKDLSSISKTDIVVLKSTPLSLPAVAGVIVNEFQTPLSHLSILGQNRKIPIAAYKHAFTDSSLIKLEGKRVKIYVSNDTLIVIETTEQIKTKSNKPIKIHADLSVNTLIDVEDLNFKSCKYAGNKAAQFGELYEISKTAHFKVPESAFAIPFYFYNKHANISGANSVINKLLDNPNIRNNSDSVILYLDSIRNIIKNTPIDSFLLQNIKNTIIAKGNYNRIRFRSSTNAEDAKNFSGAGLYTSKTGIIDSTNKSVETAIKKVWASLWLPEAFNEREIYNIDHKKVYMGILVHRSFPNEAVNGVAITTNLYRPTMPGFVVNAQYKNENVVKPSKNVICDQFICYSKQHAELYNLKRNIEIISISNLGGNELCMTQEEIYRLADELERIKAHFYKNTFTYKDYQNFALDIEFKIDGENRNLYIKQARLYNN